MLPSDELGEKGESRFKEICADARLICNKSDRDRTGWDFLVEFPFEQAVTSIDEREVPLSAHIQVKTISSSKSTVRLLLSAAERLAKEIKPAFIYVFKVNEDLTFSQSYVIHIAGERLASILKRLRKEHATGNEKKINQKHINFTLQPDEALASNGSALRDTMLRICGNDITSYSHRKQRELQTLGFENGAFKGTFKLPALPDDEILNVFLGLRKNVEVEDVRTFRTRFGIDIPYRIEKTARITFSPHCIEECTLIIRNKKDEAVTSFKTEMFAVTLPGNPTGRGKVLLKTKTFSVTLDLNSGTSQSYDLNYDLDAINNATLEDWESFWRMMHLFSKGHGLIEVNRADPSKFTSIPIIKSPKLFKENYCKSWLQYISDIKAVLAISGFNERVHMTFGNLLETEEEILLILRLWKSKALGFTFSYSLLNEAPRRFPKDEMIVTKVIQLGDRTLAYYGVGIFEHSTTESGMRSSSKNFKLRNISVLSEASHFDAYISRATIKEQTNNIFRFDVKEPARLS